MSSPFQITEELSYDLLKQLGLTMFTAKHYTAVAKVIHARRVAARETHDDIASKIALETINGLTLALSKLFEQDNPKFKTFTFIETCNADLKSE